MKKIIKIAAIVIVVVIAGLVLLTIVPEFGGYKALVVTSSSMEPTILRGSMVFIGKSDGYRKGDIVTYQMGLDSGSLTTHRIMDVREVNEREFYETKGDAVEQSDFGLVAKDRVAGKVFFSLPHLGYPISFAKTQLGVVALVVIPAAIIVYEELKTIGRELAFLRKKVGKLEREEKILDEVTIKKKGKKN